MKATLIQMNAQPDKARNLANAERLVTQAVEVDQPDLVVLPENFNFEGGTVDERLSAAETFPDGESYSTIQRLARDLEVAIHVGSLLEATPGGQKVRNTTIVFDRAGRQIAKYSKIHLFDIVTPAGTAYRESESVERGQDIALYELGNFRFGCAICYDIRFPEIFRALVDRGATAIILPAAFTMETGKDHWEVLCRARAIETQTYFIACGQTGSHFRGKEERFNYGHSLVVDPWGHVIAKASDGEGFVSTRLNADLVDQVRAQIPLSQHRVLGV